MVHLDSLLNIHLLPLLGSRRMNTFDHKVVESFLQTLDVALAVALGGDCLADVAMLRCEPAVFGPVASDPTVSRLIDTLAASAEKALQAGRSAR